MVARLLFFCQFFIVFRAAVFAQTARITFSTPEKLSVNINEDGEELMPLLSVTGDTLFFSRAVYNRNTGGEFAGMDIWISAKNTETGEWNKASNNLPAGWNNKRNNIVIGMSNDGDIIYFNNSTDPDRGILFSKRLQNQWTKPESIPIKGLSVGSFHGFYMYNSKVLFISMERDDSFGEEDLYVVLKDSTGWGIPINLGATINTEGYEISPFLSSDGEKLFFTSNLHAGYGDADVFMSDRVYKSWDVWTKPKNLGMEINTEYFDSYFSIYGDTLVYFTSNREGKMSDIYTSNAKEVSMRNQELIESLIDETRELLSEIQEDNMGNKQSLIIFDSGSYNLREDHEIILDIFNRELQPEMKSKAKYQLTFSTENNSLEQRELLLFRLRLNSIKDYLVENGVDSEMILLMRSGENLNNMNILDPKNTVVLLKKYN